LLSAPANPKGNVLHRGDRQHARSPRPYWL
jgi:hypothetical protein